MIIKAKLERGPGIFWNLAGTNLLLSVITEMLPLLWPVLTMFLGFSIVIITVLFVAVINSGEPLIVDTDGTRHRAKDIVRFQVKGKALTGTFAEGEVVLLEGDEVVLEKSLRELEELFSSG